MEAITNIIYALGGATAGIIIFAFWQELIIFKNVEQWLENDDLGEDIHPEEEKVTQDEDDQQKDEEDMSSHAEALDSKNFRR